MFQDDRGLLQGTLPLLILSALSRGASHGYAIARWIEETTDDALRVEEGSLYPALHRMAKKGWISSEWGLSENNRRARFYSLTDRGRSQLCDQARGWNRMVDIMKKAFAAGDLPQLEKS